MALALPPPASWVTPPTISVDSSPPKASAAEPVSESVLNEPVLEHDVFNALMQGSGTNIVIPKFVAENEAENEKKIMEMGAEINKYANAKKQRKS